MSPIAISLILFFFAKLSTIFRGIVIVVLIIAIYCFSMEVLCEFGLPCDAGGPFSTYCFIESEMLL